MASGILARFMGGDEGLADPDRARRVLQYYLSQGLDFRDKRVVEIGGGGDGEMGDLLLGAGARLVILVDPDSRPGVAANGRILRYRDLGEVPTVADGRIGVLCSHFRLERMPDLDSLFRGIARLLAPDGISHHRVSLPGPAASVFRNHPLLARWILGAREPRLLPDYAGLAARHGLDLDIRGMRMESPARRALDPQVLEFGADVTRKKAWDFRPRSP